MAASSRRSRGSVLAVKSQSIFRSGPFINSAKMTSDASHATPVPSSFASSTSYYSSSASADFFARRRPTSPSRVSLHTLYSQPPRPTIRFHIDGSTSPRRSITAAAAANQVVRRSQGHGDIRNQKTCLCSPTSHPGSFRCALHKNNFGGESGIRSTSYSPNRLNMRRSAMTNSLVRIGTVEGDLVKRALSALIRPSSHQQRRRARFQPRQSLTSLSLPGMGTY